MSVHHSTIREDAAVLNSAYPSFQDAPVPPGFDTAYAYFSRANPEAFEWLEDPETAIADGAHPELFAMAKLHRFATIEVEAPSALKRRGIDKVAAFPMELLWRYYG